MEVAAYEEMAELEDRHWWFVGRRAIIDALLARLPLPEGAEILEIGCGSGGNLPMLARYGRVYAGEYDDVARGRAADRGVAAEIRPCALPEDFPFEESFDLIVLADVLEHIDDDRGSLAVIRHHLKDSGWLMLTVPMFPFLWSSLDRHSHHFRRYTRGDLNEKLREADLQPSYQSFFNFWLFPVIALVRFGKNLAGKEGGDLRLPSPSVNSLLTCVLASERFAMGRFALPFGVSYIVAAQPASVTRESARQ